MTQMIIWCDDIDIKKRNRYNVDDEILRCTLNYKFFYKGFLFIEIINLDVHISNIRLS
jgi:hypothetical protein